MTMFRTGPTRVVLLAALLGAVLSALPAVGAHDHTGQVSPPRPFLQIEPVGEVTVGGSYAILTVTFNCLADEELSFSGYLKQDSIVLSPHSYRGRYLDCQGEPVKEEIIFSTYGTSRIRPGKALAEMQVRLCMDDEVYLGCRTVNKDKIVQLELAGAPLGLPI